MRTDCHGGEDAAEDSHEDNVCCRSKHVEECKHLHLEKDTVKCSPEWQTFFIDSILSQLLL